MLCCSTRAQRICSVAAPCPNTDNIQHGSAKYLVLRIYAATNDSRNGNETHCFRWILSGARANRQNNHRCHLDFANAIVASRRMPQFSASSQIGLFQPSSRAIDPLPLQHSARLAKMLAKAAGCQKAVNRL